MYVFFLFSLGKNTDRPIEKTVVTIDLKCQYLHFLFQIKKKFDRTAETFKYDNIDVPPSLK